MTPEQRANALKASQLRQLLLQLAAAKAIADMRASRERSAGHVLRVARDHLMLVGVTVKPLDVHLDAIGGWAKVTMWLSEQIDRFEGELKTLENAGASCDASAATAGTEVTQE